MNSHLKPNRHFAFRNSKVTCILFALSVGVFAACSGKGKGDEGPPPLISLDEEKVKKDSQTREEYVDEQIGPRLKAQENIAAGRQAARSRALPATEALVQVFTYGLGVVKFDPDFRVNPEKITFHLPTASHHEKQLLIGSHLDGSGLRWQMVLQPGTTRPIDLAGTKITFPGLTNPQLEARHVSSPGGELPRNSIEAEDARWFIHAGAFENGALFPASGADTQVEFKNGVLETCGLAHSANIQEVCRLQTTGTPPALRRAATEYAVVRYTIPRGRSSVTVKLSTPGRPDRSISVPQRGGSRNVIFKDKSYSEVFDILIVNLQTGHAPDDLESGRILNGKHLRLFSGLFPSANRGRGWELSTPDCKNDRGTSCMSCISGLQPECMDYLDDYRGQPSGANRPLCPVIGYP